MPVRSAIVTGADGPLRRRLESLLREDEANGAPGLVDLGWPLPRPRDHNHGVWPTVEATRRALDRADAENARAVVHLSSATVYGAWPDNPVPLTEEEPLRPNPGVADAVEHAEAERLVAAWRDDHPDATVAVFRPATLVGPEVDTWLSRALGGQPRLRSGGADPVRQFVHIDDLAGALALALSKRLDGIFNVAADGWLAGEVVRGLSAARPSFPVPGLVAGQLARWAFDLRLSDVPPEMMALIEHPWVIANDRLRAAGWTPGYSNEEAVVAARPGGRWREMSVAQRQQVAMAGVGAVVVSAGGAAAAIVSRRRRARRP